MRARIAAACAAMLVLIATGCTSMQTVSAPTDDAVEAVRTGDTVRIVTADGRDVVMKVESLDREALEGEVREVRADPGGDLAPGGSLRIPLEDARTVQVERIDGWKTAGFVGGSIALGYLIGVVLVTTLVIIPL